MEIDDQVPRRSSTQRAKYSEDLSKNTAHLNGELSNQENTYTQVQIKFILCIRLNSELTLSSLSQNIDMRGSQRAPPQDSRPVRKRSAPPQYEQDDTPIKQTRKISKKRKVSMGKVKPKSLPFLSETNDGSETHEHIAAVIVEEEKGNDQWQPEEVVNFFRGLYVHGWKDDSWNKIAAIVKTQSSQNIKAYAMKLEKRHPELKIFFSAKKKKSTKKSKHTTKIVSDKTSRHTNTAPPQNYNPKTTSTSINMQSVVKPSGPKKPKVIICLGEHVIDTETEPSLITTSASRNNRTADTLPDYFDPSIRPSVPTDSHQIFIPGNKVYARWLNREDPGSYGTWYPGIVISSTLSPVQDEYNNTGVPNLLYHVKFEDGAESMHLDTEDIMMADQYLIWLKEIEQYYSMPITEEMTHKRLTKNTRVYSKWVDPTDPEIHGCWLKGVIHNSQTWEDAQHQWRHSYSVKFDNGDTDEHLQDGDVLEEETYIELMREKMERGKNRSRMSGFDLIAQASEIASPIKETKSKSDTLVGASTEKKLYTEKATTTAAAAVNVDDDNDVLMEELRCNEVLELPPPSPSTARISSTPSPDVHYGIYMKSKPWLVDTAAISNTVNGKENAVTTQESVRPSTAKVTSNKEELPEVV